VSLSKYQDVEDADLKTGSAELKLPSEDSVPGQVIKLKQVKQAILLSLENTLTGCKDLEVHKLKIGHLTEMVDKGFERVQDQIWPGYEGWIQEV
jgi:hypothetical protein